MKTEEKHRFSKNKLYSSLFDSGAINPITNKPEESVINAARVLRNFMCFFPDEKTDFNLYSKARQSVSEYGLYLQSQGFSVKFDRLGRLRIFSVAELEEQRTQFEKAYGESVDDFLSRISLTDGNGLLKYTPLNQKENKDICGFLNIGYKKISQEEEMLWRGIII